MESVLEDIEKLEKKLKISTTQKQKEQALSAYQ